MTLPTAIRPRTVEERLAMARALMEAPRVVALTHPGDGWEAAALRIAGRVPVWANDGDPSQAEALLERLGLPGLGSEQPGGTLDGKLQMRRNERVGGACLPPVSGPLVSIIICTFNRAHMVREAIYSALAQSWPVEVIVVNDGSTDETSRVLDSIGDITVIEKENGGKPSALAAGLKAARGEAILTLDDDDLILPGALNVLATALFSNPHLVAVWGDSIFIDERGEAVVGERAGLRYPQEMMRSAILQQIPAATGATLMRASAVRAIGGYDARLIRGEDMDLFLRLSYVGGLESIPFATFLLRSHDGVRGTAGEGWRKSDRAEDWRRFLNYTTEAFRERWVAGREGVDRREGFAWALGLWQRELREEALEELARWPGPFTRSEAWVRGEMGQSSLLVQHESRMVVVDNGDPGALEETLMRQAEGSEVIVNLEVPREPLGNIKLYWEGEFHAQARLHSIIPNDGRETSLRLSSAPEWAPPPLSSLALLPDLPAPSAVRAVAAVENWAIPDEVRQGLRGELPVVLDAWRCRLALQVGAVIDALGALTSLLQRAPGWPGAWSLAAELFESVGEVERAREWRSRLTEAVEAARPKREAQAGEARGEMAG